MARKFTDRNIAYQARHYHDLPEDVRDAVAWEHAGWELIYFCPECDEEHPDDFTACPRFPAEHDDTGYMGTGTKHPEPLRQLARLIAEDY